MPQEAIEQPEQNITRCAICCHNIIHRHCCSCNLTQELVDAVAQIESKGTLPDCVADGVATIRRIIAGRVL